MTSLDELAALAPDLSWEALAPRELQLWLAGHSGAHYIHRCDPATVRPPATKCSGLSTCVPSPPFIVSSCFER